MLILWCLLGLAAAAVLISYICYRIVFYAKPSDPLGPDEFNIPDGEIYEPHREQMKQWMRQMRSLPRQEVTITSRDGLQLWGSYYEYAPGAVMELMFHGYRGTAERDLCGGVQRAFDLGRNVLIVDQRTACRSQGRTITFGIKEHKDCLDWVNFCIDRFGPDVRIILTGISMGASTVLLASGEQLPKQVVGVLADCGFTSARDIICKCARDMKLPPKLVYPFIRLGAVLFGGFDPDSHAPVEAVRRCKVPVIFFHGEADDFVPCRMSKEMFDACASQKRLVTVPGAGHGLCYIIDPDTYLQEMADFFTQNGVPTHIVQ